MDCISNSLSYPYWAYASLNHPITVRLFFFLWAIYLQQIRTERYLALPSTSLTFLLLIRCVLDGVAITWILPSHVFWRPHTRPSFLSPVTVPSISRSRDVVTLKLILFSWHPPFFSFLVDPCLSLASLRNPVQGVISCRVSHREARPWAPSGRGVGLSSGSSGMFYQCDLRHTWRDHGVIYHLGFEYKVLPQLIAFVSSTGMTPSRISLHLSLFVQAG